MSKRKASRIICAISAMFTLGVVGGIEKFLLPLGTGALWLIIGFAVFALSAIKGGVIKWQSREKPVSGRRGHSNH